jgi:hypothetical protein
MTQGPLLFKSDASLPVSWSDTHFLTCWFVCLFVCVTHSLSDNAVMPWPASSLQQINEEQCQFCFLFYPTGSVCQFCNTPAEAAFVTSQERYVIVLQSACEWVLRVAKQQATYYMMRRDFAWSLGRVSLALGCCGISSHVKGNGLGAGGLCVCG